MRARAAQGGGARAGTESRARHEAGSSGGSSNPGGTVIHMHGLFRVIEAELDDQDVLHIDHLCEEQRRVALERTGERHIGVM